MTDDSMVVLDSRPTDAIPRRLFELAERDGTESLTQTAAATLRRVRDGARGRSRRHSRWPVPEDTSVQELFDALNDGSCRALLAATGEEALTAAELSEQCDIPLSTVYRKLDCLVELGLLEQTVRIRKTGANPNEHRRTVDGIHFRFDDRTMVVSVAGEDDGTDTEVSPDQEPASTPPMHEVAATEERPTGPLQDTHESSTVHPGGVPAEPVATSLDPPTRGEDESDDDERLRNVAEWIAARYWLPFGR